LKPTALPTRAGALLLAAALAIAPPLAQAQVRLPALGESAGEEFSLSTERTLGQQIMREIRRDPAYLDDPPLLDYVQRIWQPLVEAARQRGEITPDTAQQLAFEVFLVRDRSVNAFALPGGYVGVHLGLIAMTTSADELAAVLAHELTHVTQRHIARGVVNAQRITLLSLAGLILGVLAASRAGSSDGVQAAVVGSQAAAAQGQLNYTRDMEREADRVGFGVLADAGYAPAGMASMFEKLDAANRLNDSGAFPYLRSHPLTVERISEARARIALGAPGPKSDRIEHALMAARARVLMDPGPEGLRRQQQRAAITLAPGAASVSTAEQLGALYGGALATLLLGDEAAADATVAKAQKLLREHPAAPAERAFRQLQAQIALQRGDAPAAWRLLDGQGDARWTLLLRGQVALALWRGGGAAACAGAAASAASAAAAAAAAVGAARCDAPAAAALRDSGEALRSWVATHANDALAWAMLAQTEDALGQPLRALRAQAESHVALGDIAGAIDRLRAAQSLARGGSANDFIEASVIDARLRQLQAQQREIAAALRSGK
jgi:predicted Zn-dependent protease